MVDGHLNPQATRSREFARLISRKMFIEEQHIKHFQITNTTICSEKFICIRLFRVVILWYILCFHQGFATELTLKKLNLENTLNQNISHFKTPELIINLIKI